MNESQIYEGGCLCGAIRYLAKGAPIGACHCHCDKCRRHSGAVFASAVGFPADDISWTNGQPALYQSSENVGRSFCGRCGSSLAHHWLDIGTVWPFIGTLDHPESVTPEFHMFTEEQIPWVSLDDGLPCHLRFPPQRKGTQGSEPLPT